MVQLSPLDKGLTGSCPHVAITRTLLVRGVGSASWQRKHGTFAQSFMVAALAPPHGSSPPPAPLPPRAVLAATSPPLSY